MPFYVTLVLRIDTKGTW